MDQNHEQGSLAILLEFSSRSWAEYQSHVLTSSAPVPEDVIIEWLIGALQAQALFESTPEGVLVYAGGLVLNCCYGPARDGDRQGVVLCVNGCEKALAPHLESAAERAFQPEEVRWTVHVVDEKAFSDGLGPITDPGPSQAVLKKLVNSASDFILSLENQGSVPAGVSAPDSFGQAAPFRGVAPTGAFVSMDVSSSVPAASGSGWVASAACREPAADEDVVVYKQWLAQVAPDLSFSSASPGELGEAVARWSAALDPSQFAVCCLGPLSMPGLQACLMQADPPVDRGEPENMVACWQEAHEIRSGFRPSQESPEGLAAEHQRNTLEVTVLQNLQNLKQKEAEIEAGLRQAKENSVRIGAVSLASSLAQARLASAIARMVRIEQSLTDAALDCLAAGGMMDARSARIREHYLVAAQHVERLASGFVRRFGNAAALHEVKRLSLDLQLVRDEIGKCTADVPTLARNSSLEDIQTRLLPLRVNLRRAGAAVQTLQLWQELCPAPLSVLAARCVRYPRVFLVPSENHDLCAVARDLGPEIAIIDSTVQPQPWLDSARLVLIWREGRIIPYRGRTPEGSRELVKSFKEALPDLDRDRGDLARLVPGFTERHFDVLLAGTGHSIP